MQPIIAVESSLGNIADYLSTSGYQVRRVKDFGARTEELRGCQAIVISGLDQNIAGYQTIAENVPVINASGEKPETILAHLRDRLAKGSAGM